MRHRVVQGFVLGWQSAWATAGDIPADRVHELQQYVPALTSGEGVLECTFDRYEALQGETPTRSRTDNNPLDWKEYLLRLGKRV